MGTGREEFARGWAPLAGATIGLACGVGNYTSISSLFFRALEREFHWSKGTAAIALIALPITAIFLPLAGRLVDRFGVGRVAAVSAILMGLSFFSLSQMTGTLGLFYLGFLAFNVLGCGTSPVSYTRTVAHRFMSARGAAMAIALSGVAIAGIALPPIIGPVLGRGGWREGYEILAGIAVVGGLLAAVLVGGERPTGPHAARGADGISLGEALRSQRFWILSAAVLAAAAPSVGFVSQLQSVAIEAGIPMPRTLALLQLVSLSVLLARLGSGWALDVFEPSLVATGVLLLSAGGMFAWFLVPQNPAWALVGCALLGLCVGAEYAFLSFFCARLFGLKNYGSIFGALAVALYCGMAIGGVFFGATHDRTGSYHTAIVAAAIALVVSAGLFWSLRRATSPAAA